MAAPTEEPSPPAQPDAERVAERVYQLMLADARLDRARGVTPGRQGGG